MYSSQTLGINIQLNFFRADDNLYYSITVKNEFEKNYNKFIYEQLNFFEALDDELDQFDMDITKEFLISLSLEIELKNNIAENKKTNYVNKFWQYYKINDKCDIDLLHSYIEDFIDEFLMLIKSRRHKLYKIIILSPKRTNAYENILNSLLNNNLHFPDIDIILDAHDLALTKKLNLDFISSDKTLCYNARNINALHINNFYYLKDYFEI